MSLVPQSHPVDFSKKRRRLRQSSTIRAALQDTRALWREFRTPIIIFFAVTVVGGYIYGELHTLAGLEPQISPIDRPYTMVQLMILETPPAYSNAPEQWYLAIFWYTLPLIFLFIVGNGVADFVRLFFDRSQRRDAWREAVASTFRRHIIVLGAGHVGLRVVHVLHDLMQVDVVVIDNAPDPGVDEYLEARHVPLIRGDGGQSSTLQKAGLKEALAFIACTGNDHTNLEAIMRARDMNRHIRIVARVWDNQFANQIVSFMNVQSVLSSSDVAAPVFAGLALGVELTQTISVAGVEYSTLRMTVNEGSFMDGRAVGTIQTDYDVDIVLHCPKGHPAEVQPNREATLHAGDTVVMFGVHERVLQIASRNQFLN